MATGFVGIYSFELFFPESHSLKEKRMHLRSVKAQLTNRVACSIAEVDHHEVWQRSRLTLACVAREGSFVPERTRVMVELSGLEKAPSQVLVGGNPAEATFDDGTVTVSLDASADARTVEVRRTKHPFARR